MGDLKASTPFIDSLISLDDFQRAARDRLPKALYEYVASGSDDEQTLWENRQGFHRVLLCPRVLVDVSRLDTTVTFFGDSSHRSSMPVLIAPAGVHCLMHPEGEKATARAAARAGVVMGVSQHATMAMEDVARAAREQQQHHHPHAPPLWYQLYILKDRPLTASLLRRALSAGYRAVALTVDSCRFGSREADWRNGFDGLPEGLSLANYPTRQAYDDRQHAAWDQNSEALLDDSVTWEEAVALVRSVCGPGVPLLLKGVLSPHDAVRAAQLGCEGIIVSNHGGRQLDSCVSSIEALPRIASALRQAGFTIDADLRASKTTPGGSAGGGRQQRVVTLVLDSGVRRGTDVVKALALGATAVMIGKPVFFALALQGETGVSRVLALLRAELEAAMALCGCPSLHHITSDLVVTKEGGHSYIRPSRL